MTLPAADLPLPPPDRLCLSRAEVAALVGLSPNQVDHCVAAGQLPAPLPFGKRGRRWYRRQLEAFLDKRAGLIDAAASHDEAASRVQQWRNRQPSSRRPSARSA